MKKIIIYTIVILSLIVSSCNLLDYEYSPPPPSQYQITSEKVKNSIDSVLISQLETKYIPYSFGQLETIKPIPFLKLDSIYLLRSNLRENTEDYQALLKKYNNEIEELKNKINDEKLYHTYQVDHIYIVKKEKGYQLHEDQFKLFPNYKLKKISPILSTPLSTKEKDLFDYFTLQNPLYETGDVSYNNQLDLLTYEKFNIALSNEKFNKAGLVHTILYSIEYIRLYNEFNEQKIAEGIADKWLIENNYNNFIPIYSKLTKEEEQKVSSYSLIAQNKKGEITIRFTLDLNLVITDITVE